MHGDTIEVIQSGCLKSKAGDFVIFTKAGSDDLILKKQISSVGDVLSIINSTLFINDHIVLGLDGRPVHLVRKEEQLLNLYALKPLSGILVLGAQNSMDSRSIGPISQEIIKGVVVE